MKKAIIITSTIEVDNNFPLTYSQVRSHFSNIDRLRHTIFTVANLDTVVDDETTLFLVDASENPAHYRGLLGYQKNLIFVSVKEQLPEIYQTVREHKNKSYCETLILQSFLERYKTALSEYDYFCKMSGRYFTDSTFDVTLFNEENTNKIFFKTPLKFEWSDTWNYSMVDRRAEQGDNNLYQYCSVLYAWGKDHFDDMLDIYRVIAAYTSHTETMQYDVETLLYYFTRKFENTIVETPWVVYGWDGTTGAFLRY